MICAAAGTTGANNSRRNSKPMVIGTSFEQMTARDNRATSKWRKGGNLSSSGEGVEERLRRFTMAAGPAHRHNRDGKYHDDEPDRPAGRLRGAGDPGGVQGNR